MDALYHPVLKSDSVREEELVAGRSPSEIQRNTLTRWETFCSRFSELTGPHGITLENTDPLKLHNKELYAQYRRLKQSYDDLLGERKLRNESKDDLAIKISPRPGASVRGGIGRQEQITGFSFFIESRPLSKQEKFKAIMAILTQKKLERDLGLSQEDSGMKASSPAPSSERKRSLFESPEDEPTSLRMKASPETQPSNEPEFLAPIPTESGGFKPIYSQCIPAIVLNSLIPQVKSPLIDLHVFCRGFKDIKNVDLDIYNDISNNVEYRAAAQKPLIPGITRRICLWVRLEDHVFMIVWDSKIIEGGEAQHECYTADCSEIHTMSNSIMTSLYIGMLSQFVGGAGKVSRLGNRITSSEIRVDYGGLVCVSFVARATLYLSMLVDPLANTRMIIDVSHFAEGNRLDAFIYRCFERHLYDFVSHNTKQGNIVMFNPKNMYEHFINIQNVQLIMEYGDGGAIHTVIYNGLQHGFVVGESQGGRASQSVCMQSCYFPGYASSLPYHGHYYY